MWQYDVKDNNNNPRQQYLSLRVCIRGHEGHQVDWIYMEIVRGTIINALLVNFMGNFTVRQQKLANTDLYL